ncbi:uncharacterized protein LOC143349538 [Colletes latitarsis]|uniref:uncharacterized protein LOC143349538 n=1 Tax=Colletes latitarsis TaxID=2605962 RepID=UPI004035277D
MKNNSDPLEAPISSDSNFVTRKKSNSLSLQFIRVFSSGAPKSPSSISSPPSKKCNTPDSQETDDTFALLKSTSNSPRGSPSSTIWRVGGKRNVHNHVYCPTLEET